MWDGTDGWDGMVIIGHRSSKSTFGAKKTLIYASSATKIAKASQTRVDERKSAQSPHNLLKMAAPVDLVYQIAKRVV